MDSWTIHAQSDSHGRFSLTNLPAGEYTVCALIPADEESAAPRVCLGDVFRRKDAKTVKVGPGETAGGIGIEIPLSGLHTVSGAVTALADGHPLNHGTVRLLYADDREKARETALLEDGSYSLEYVPEAKYILQVSDAQDEEQKVAATGQGDAQQETAQTVPVRKYADKEMPLTVLNNTEDFNIVLAAAAPADAAAAAGPTKQ
jgi:hypothetical protein